MKYLVRKQEKSEMRDFMKFLKRRRKAKFAPAKEEEIQQLIKLGKEKLPNEFLEVYSNMMPEHEIEIKDIVIYPMSRIKEENFNCIPGVNIYPLGFFTFASTLEGDAICIDLNDEKRAVYQCSHSLLANGETISFYMNQMVSLEFCYENIIRCSVKLANSYVEFTKKLLKGRIFAHNVVEYAIDNYEV